MDLKNLQIAMDDRFVLKKRLEAQDMNLNLFQIGGLKVFEVALLRMFSLRNKLLD
jgi:hypothetical protein